MWLRRYASLAAAVALVLGSSDSSSNGAMLSTLRFKTSVTILRLHRLLLFLSRAHTGVVSIYDLSLIAFLLSRSASPINLSDECRKLNIFAVDEAETKHLQALEGAETRLHLFQIDLLDYESLVSALVDCSGVFHLASPCIVDQVRDPEKELLDPAIKGTTNVLRAAKEVGIGRVVVTSSSSAIMPSPSWPADKVKNEDCWTDIEYCKQNGLWYPLSKTLAEKAAWDFAKGEGLDVVVVNPGTVMGPLISPRLNASMLMLVRLLQGCTETYENFFMGSVHFKDAALAHVMVYENKAATGRHLCVEAISHYGDFVAMVAELYPDYNIPRLPRDTQPGLLRAKDGGKKLADLGLEFISMEKIITDAVESLKNKGFIS